MKTKLVTIAILSAFVCGAGFGYSQREEPHFYISVDAPVGETHLRCDSGCSFIGANDLSNRVAAKMKTYTFWCSNETGCRGKAAGWREE